MLRPVPRTGHSRDQATVIFDELRAIQLRLGYLPKAELEALSDRTQTPLYQLHSVASFYPHFHLTPPAKAEVRAELLRRFAGLPPTDVQLKDVSCLGRCDQALAAAVNDEIYVNVNADKVEDLARRAIRGDHPRAEHPHEPRVACASDPYGDGEKYGVLRQLVSTRNYDGVLATLKESELKGMGGAGFPTSLKWDLVRKQAEPIKYVVCNADESEPGTIKDRFIISHLPHLVIEGMIIAGLVTRAQKGIFYIRHEYPLQEEIF